MQCCSNRWNHEGRDPTITWTVPDKWNKNKNKNKNLISSSTVTRQCFCPFRLWSSSIIKFKNWETCRPVCLGKLLLPLPLHLLPTRRRILWRQFLLLQLSLQVNVYPSYYPKILLKNPGKAIFSTCPKRFHWTYCRQHVKSRMLSDQLPGLEKLLVHVTIFFTNDLVNRVGTTICKHAVTRMNRFGWVSSRGTLREDEVGRSGGKFRPGGVSKSC